VDATRDLTVAVTSDRGLCGGLNSNITKYTKALLAIYGKGGPPRRASRAEARLGTAHAAAPPPLRRPSGPAAPSPRRSARDRDRRPVLGWPGGRARRRHHRPPLAAGNPKDKQLATIGDKGRSQLARIEGDRFVLNINETYKVKVTFPQVGCRRRCRRCGARRCWVGLPLQAAQRGGSGPAWAPGAA
jgi:hypothetical protein